MCLARLESLLVGKGEGPIAEIVQLGMSAERCEAWLRKNIGPNTWVVLDPQSRDDLIGAEQRYSMSYLELGAGRRDWGGFAVVYARALDREVRTLVGPLVRRLEKAGFFEDSANDLNYGNCIARIRKANDARRQRGQPLPRDDEAHFERLFEFAKANGYVTAYRDRAVHANQEPITSQEFVKWRGAFFEKGIFNVILNVSP
jgi:hypothetical protein